MSQIATVAYTLLIFVLFRLDRDAKAYTSKALFVPVCWMCILGSRMVSQWLQMAPSLDSPDQYLEGSPLDRNILMGLIIAGVITLLGRRSEVVALLQPNAPLLLFFLYCLVSILWSDYPDVAFKRWIKFAGDAVMVLVVLTDPGGSAAVDRFFARTSYLLFPVSILLIKYYPDLGRGYDRWTGMGINIGVTTNKNLLGMVCLVLGLGSLWRFLRALRERPPRRGPLLSRGIIVAMGLWLLVTSHSATSLSCFFMGGGLMLLTSLPWVARKRTLVHTLVALILAVAFCALFLGLGTSLVETMGRDPTLTGRTQIWDVILNMTANPLLGTGFDSFWLGKRLDKLWAMYWWQPNESHNGYIETYLNLGWLGVLLLAALILTGYAKVMSALHRNHPVANLSLAYVVVAIAYNFTEAAFKKMHPVWWFFLFAIFAVSNAIYWTPAPRCSLAPVEPEQGISDAGTGASFDEEVQPIVAS